MQTSFSKQTNVSDLVLSCLRLTTPPFWHWNAWGRFFLVDCSHRLLVRGEGCTLFLRNQKAVLADIESSISFIYSLANISRFYLSQAEKVDIDVHMIIHYCRAAFQQTFEIVKQILRSFHIILYMSPNLIYNTKISTKLCVLSNPVTALS